MDKNWKRPSKCDGTVKCPYHATMGPTPQCGLDEVAKPKVQLTGHDGNAFLVLGLCIKAGRKAGWTDDSVAAFRTEAVQGDYDHLLQTAMKYFDVE